MGLRGFATEWRDFRNDLVSKARVLVVDDEPGMLDLLSLTLEGEALTVSTAETAEAAWTQIEMSLRRH